MRCSSNFLVTLLLAWASIGHAGPTPRDVDAEAAGAGVRAATTAVGEATSAVEVDGVAKKGGDKTTRKK
jgi:hypothetical protein